jgi:hypothetical protein
MDGVMIGNGKVESGLRLVTFVYPSKARSDGKTTEKTPSSRVVCPRLPADTVRSSLVN